MSKKSRIDGLDIWERIAKMQEQQPEVSANISLTNFEGFRPIIDAIGSGGQFAIKYSDGAGVALFDCDTMEILDYYAAEFNHTTCVSPHQFITTIKLYLINHREIITAQEAKNYIEFKKKIILLN